MAEIISKELLEILACPVCKGDVKLIEEESKLVCEKCKIDYPIVDGIPHMLPPEDRVE